MATLNDSMVSSSARKLTIRKRLDLSARKQQYLGRSYWVVKEPVGLNYYRFQEEEYAILNMLDGENSLDEIKDRFESEFPPQKITLEELQQFIGMLHRSGLVIVGVAGQGEQLCKRRNERRRKEILGAASNILCIRFKGFDPERILNWLYPYCSWFFTKAVFVICLLMALAALTLVGVQFDVFRSRLPDFQQFFSVKNAILLAATLGITKIFHEFGHGLCCKHFGGECHEMGVMILVLTPCLYCNVSDSWMLPSKWQRAAIGAAGMYVEVVIASICTFLWWFTNPGMFNHLCLNVMFIASVTTLIFNANPLLRYDGYYILADIAEIPNLRQKATSILSRKMGQWFLGLEPPEDPFLPERNQIFFVLYSIAAATYRWFIMASILYLMFKIFEPYRLEILGHVIVAMSLYGLIVMPLYKVGKFFYVPGRIDKVKKPRMYASLAGLALIVTAILYIPLPHSITCTLEVQARDAKSVYVDVGGTLESIVVKSGERVKKGQLLAKLENIDTDLEVVRLAGTRDQYRRQLENLRRNRFHDKQAGAEIPQIKKALETVEDQLGQKIADQKRLLLVAPIAGTVMPPPSVPDRKTGDGQLPQWSGSTLERENLGCFLEPSVLFCQVGDPKKLEAILVIDQADIAFVRKGQTVEILLEEMPHEPIEGEDVKITEIANRELTISPERLSTKAGGELPTVTDASGIERPMNASYQALVPLDDPDNRLRLGLRGTAKIHTDPQTLGQRVWRFISQLVNFKL